MKYIVIALATLQVSALWSAAQDTNAPPPAPDLVCDQPAHDFGTRRDHETVNHRFEFRNAGDAVLKISRVRASCGCTVAKTSTNSLPPGGEAYVEARFKLKGRRGRQHKTITIESNDPDTPRLSLRLKGTIVNEVGLDPRYLAFNQVHRDSVATKTVKLTSRLPEIRITGIVSDNPAFTNTIAADGRSFTVATVPPMAEGPQRAALKVETDHPENISVNLQAIAVVVGDVVVIPRDILVRRSVPTPVKRAITIRPAPGKTVGIVGIDLPVEGLTVTRTALPNGTYTLTIDGLTAALVENAKPLVIRTDVESTPRIEIPFRIVP